MVHSLHRSGVVLDDDCVECVSRANLLIGLDRKTLLWLVKVSEIGHFGRTPTKAEVNAQANVWHALLVMERLAERDWRDVLGRDVLDEAVHQPEPTFA